MHNFTPFQLPDVHLPLALSTDTVMGNLAQLLATTWK